MARLSNQRSADPLPSFSGRCPPIPVGIDQPNKADAQLIPEAYIYALGVQCLVSLSDGLVGYAFPLNNTLAVQKPPIGSTGPMRAPDATTPTEPVRTGLRTAGVMLDAGWPALFATHSFLLTVPRTSPNPSSVPHVTRSSLPLRKLHSQHGSSPRAMKCNRPRLCYSPPSQFEGLTLGSVGGS